MRPCRSPHGEGQDRDRPDLPLPPARMPLLRGGRPLKRWRWVGAFGPDAMACATRVSIGGMPVAWWVVWDGERLHERMHRRAGPVRMEPGHVRTAGFDLRFEEDEGVEVVSPHGKQYIWTRKQGGIAVRGTVLGRPVRGPRVRRRHRRLPRARHRVALVGRRRRRGVGRAAWRGTWSRACTTASPSERTVWVDGTPHHVEPLPFADDLSAVGDLRCEPVAVRAHRERLLLLASEYEMPFGRFSGSLPHAGPLREGWGVMERHKVRW